MVLREVNQRFSVFPFALRALEESSRITSARLGVVECQRHQLLEPFVVLYEKEGEYIAQFKFTALILPTGTVRLTQYTMPPIQSNHEISDPALLELLKTPLETLKHSPTNFEEEI
jgi:hypothetical protein